jgi:hypothetical protein
MRHLALLLVLALATLPALWGWSVLAALPPGGAAPSDDEHASAPNGDPAAPGEPLLAGRAQPPASTAVPEPEIELPWEPLPDDPVEDGAAVLVLTFVGRGTGAPVPTRFDLWRLDAPGSGDWGRGDQRQVAMEERASEHVLARLPEGRYRVHAYDVRKEEAEDPPPFEVRGRRTHVTLELAAPRLVRATLVVFDETGRRIEAGVRQGSSSYVTFAPPAVPGWVVPRRSASGFLAEEDPDDVEIFRGCGGRTETAVVAEHGVFPLGRYEEAARYKEFSRSLGLSFEGRSRIDVRVAPRGGEDLTYIALSVPLAWVRDRLLGPDGRRPCDVDAVHVHACCEAVVLAEGADPFESARALPIKVCVRRGTAEVAKGTLLLDDPRSVVTVP